MASNNLSICFKNLIIHDNRDQEFGALAFML